MAPESASLDLAEIAETERSTEQPSSDPQAQHGESNTRRSRDRRQKQSILDRRAKALELETRVLGIAASGASQRAIARRLDLSPAYVHEVYHRAMDRVEGEHVEAYKSAVMHRLGLVLQQAWTDAFNRELTPQQRSMARRDILAVTDQMNRLQGAYPPQQVDVVGEMTVRRELSEAEVLETLANIQADLILAGEADLPDGLVLTSPIIDATPIPSSNGQRALESGAGASPNGAE